MQIDVPEAFTPLFTSKKRFIVYAGGRGSGKSVTIAKYIVCRVHKEGIKVLCAREFQNSLDDSVYAILVAAIDEMKLTGFNIQAGSIFHTNGGEIKFKGLARNPHSMKSLHGFNLCFVEEAQTMSEQSLKLLTPTIREEGSQLLFAANPQSSADAFSQRFIVPFQAELDRDDKHQDDLHDVFFVNYDCNPWFPKELDNDRLWDFDNLPRAQYDHIWLGAFNDSVENSIIQSEWFDAAIDAHTKLGFKGNGAIVAAHDPSDLGRDSKGFALRHGSVVLDVKEKLTGDVNEGCDWAMDLATDARANYFIFDADGLGVSLRRQVLAGLDGQQCDAILFKGSEGVKNPDSIYQGDRANKDSNRTNKETFKNHRAQAYWTLRDRFYNTYRAVVNGEYVDPAEMISISSSIDCIPMLRSEVCRIPRIPNGNGLIQLMQKDKMKSQLGIESPNLSDSLAMCFSDIPTNKKKKQAIRFNGAF